MGRCPSRRPTRSFISPAALLVKVTAKIRSGATPCLIDQPGDAHREDAGLARAGAGHHQQGAVHVLDRLPLGGIEAV